MLAPLEEAVTADMLTVKCVDSTGWENKTDVDIIIKEKKKKVRKPIASYLQQLVKNDGDAPIGKQQHRKPSAASCQLGFFELATSKEQGNDQNVTLRLKLLLTASIVTVSAAFKSSTKSFVMLVQTFMS